MADDRIHYVLGFLLTADRRSVMLIRKNRPSFQAGRLNGVGGKVEAGETALVAMVRECREESGLDIETWQPVAVLQSDRIFMEVFVAFDDKAAHCKTCTDEEVGLYDVLNLQAHASIRPLGPNLLALLSIALDDRLAWPVQLQLKGSQVPEPGELDRLQLRRVVGLQGDAIEAVLKRAMRCRGEQSYRDTVNWAVGFLGETAKGVKAALPGGSGAATPERVVRHRVSEAEHLAIMGWDAGSEAAPPVVTWNVPVDSEDGHPLVPALVALARLGIPPDIQELLVHGDPARGIRPGALAAALRMVSNHQPAPAYV